MVNIDPILYIGISQSFFQDYSYRQKNLQLQRTG